MRYLITGACGFIGSNFIEYLLKWEPDARIIAYDKLTYAGNTRNLSGEDKIHCGEDFDMHYTALLDPRILFVVADICHRLRVERYVEMCDYIINFAAETHVDNSIENQTPFLQSNYIGVGVLLDAARRYNKPMLQVSTDEVYGSKINGKWLENAPLNPSSPYAASKAASDLLCLAHYKTYGTKVIITRCCNNYGPKQHPEKFIPKAILSGLRGKEMPIYGNGLNQRQWIFVEDHCRALFPYLIGGGRYGKIYNIGTPDIITNMEMLKSLSQFIPTTAYQYVEDRLGHDWRYAVNYDIISRLGWNPTISLEDGLKYTVQWYKENYETV